MFPSTYLDYLSLKMLLETHGPTLHTLSIMGELPVNTETVALNSRLCPGLRVLAIADDHADDDEEVMRRA